MADRGRLKYPPGQIDDVTGLAGYWDPAAIEMIQQGYKCARCAEEWSFYLAACPVCRHVLDPTEDFQPCPQHWLPDPTDPRYDEE